MHRPIFSLCARTTRGHRRIETWSLVGARVIAIQEPHFAGVDVACLETWPGVFEKLQTVPARKVGIFDQRDGRVHQPPDPTIRFLLIFRPERRTTQRTADQHPRQHDRNVPGHGRLAAWAFLRSNKPIINNGHTTVASLKTSANRPPSFRPPRPAPGATSASGPDPLAREAGVLGRREVRVGAERALRGEVEHLRPERRRQPLVARDRRIARVKAVEERPHGGERARVVARRLGVPDADAQQEAAGKRRVSSACCPATSPGACRQTLRMPVATVSVLDASR